MMQYRASYYGCRIENRTQAFEWYRFEWPSWVTCNLFQGHDIIQRQITQKWYQIVQYLQWQTNRKSNMIYRTAPFLMILNDPYPQYQGHAILWRWIYLRNGTTYRHSFNEILIETYTRPTQHCHFQWPWEILSDLAKYSMTRSARGISATAELLVQSYELIEYRVARFYGSGCIGV